ncbi:hypothetical protein NWUPM3A1_246 [Escherichia phage vB_EcoM_3A1_SA_NWU]|uniref:Phage protein n=6 Tax=Phapecoctavirus TaxID=2733124 RepID=A0A6B9X2P3_9CAUD|nr:hypothetical protein [Escherichia coli]YP_009985063.1 hypothetical protein JR319_gp119 [Escherichia phage vB_EcoM-Ro121c4YLVW]YP_009986246.1 hypothetical protein JR324_gp126 [Escherichia phage nieznany]YP_009986418.1 hypothetical protein JR325_gp042 [Escherichia phage tuntematon]YP_009986954.1 hypothetical protein JR327_gp029 [Escherichia phage Mt1B1_P17]YP_010356291.1 MAG: hypothetical protein M1M20_gp122 [Dompiswa phage TSP7_1]AXA27789.1 hypothetical protein vBEcoMRo121lw_00265 [Escheric
MAIIAKTEIIGLDSILLAYEETLKMYVVTYGDYVREYEYIDLAFECYIRQVNKAYNDYR